MLRFWPQLLAPITLALSAVFSSGLAVANPLMPAPTNKPTTTTAKTTTANTTTANPSPTPVAVTATTGLVTIESDLQKADNSTGVVTATGNVRIVYPDQRVVATSRQAQYFSREGRVVLSGDVDVLQDSGHSIRAERLVYLVERERIVAEPAPGEQVITHYRLNAPVLKPEAPKP